MAAQDLCTLADVRQALELETDETKRDTLIGTLITQASDAILAHSQREFAPVTASATRRFRVDPRRTHRGARLVELRPYDLRTVTSVKLNPEETPPTTLVAGSDYLLEPEGAPQGVYSQVKISRSVLLQSATHDKFGFAYIDIAGAWGFATVPENVQRATVVTVMAWLDKPIADQLVDVDPREFNVISPRRLDIPLAAIRLLNPYRRPPFA